MRKPRRVILVAILCVASILSSAHASATTVKPRKFTTDFGYVLVDPLDVKAAIAEGEAAQEAASRVLLLPYVRFGIVEEGSGKKRWGSVENGDIIYVWPFPNGARRFAARPPIDALRQEIGHDLLERYLVRRSTTEQYGTDAPDWLDEMTAIAFEGAEQASDRRKTVRSEAASGELLPLRQLLSMRHPELRAGGVPSGNQAIASTAPSSADTIRFYSTIQALYDFLLSRTGDPAIVARLVSAFSRGDDLSAAVIARLNDHREADSFAQADAALAKFIATDPRYVGPHNAQASEVPASPSR